MSDTPRFSDRCLQFSLAVGAISIAAGLLVLCGWALDIAHLKSMVPGLATMKPNTALCFILCGMGLWLHARTAAHSSRAGAGLRRGYAAVPAILALLIGAASVAEYAFGLDSGIDRILFGEAVLAETELFAGRMSLAAAASFVLVGLTLATAGARFGPELPILPVLLAALLAINGYVYDAPALYRVGAFSSTALPTGLLFALLSTGILASYPQRGLCRLISAQDGGGMLARRMLPLAILTPIAVGWLCWLGELAGLYDTAFGFALFTSALVAMLAAQTLFVSGRLRRFDAARMRNASLIDVQARALEQVALGRPLGEVLNALLQSIESMDDEMLTSVLLLSEDGTRVHHGAAPRLPVAYTAAIEGLPIGPTAGSCGTAAWRRAQVVVSDIASDPLWQDYRALAAEHGLAACWSTPIFGQDDRLLGTFAIYYREPKTPDKWHHRIIGTATHIVAVAIERVRAMEALIQGRANLEAAQERGRIGSWELELGASRGRWSRQMSRIFGRDPQLPAPTLEELLDLVHPEDRTRLEDILSHPESMQAQGRMDFRLQNAAGEMRYLSGTFDLLRDPAGKPQMLAGTVLDTTDRTLADMSIRQALVRVRELSRRLAETEEEERRSIGRELHDRIGADLAAVKLNLDLIGATLPADTPAAATTRLTDTRQLVQSAIEHSRDVLAELRPPGLDDHGLLIALRMHAETVETRLGIPVSVAGSGIDPPPHLVETALYRIVQEALNNIAKHAHAHCIDIVLEQTAAELRLAITDDGDGFDAARVAGTGYGFRTMRERAEAVGATLQIDSRPGQGTRILITVERAPWF